MSSNQNALNSINDSLENWVVYGPFMPPAGEPACYPADLDAAVRIPSGPVILEERRLASVKANAKRGIIDFRKLLGHMPERAGAYAFSEVEIPSPGALTLSWHADYWAELWMDGNNILSLGRGNMGSFPERPHTISCAVEAGRHVFCVRVMSGREGWISFLRADAFSAELPDFMREDRGAVWRDYNQASVRLEHRPPPDDSFYGLGMKRFESWLASSGVDARWIGLTDHIHGAYFYSENLPPSEKIKPEYEAQFKDWIKYLREKRFSVITWLPLTLWGSAWEKNPDWRVKFLVDPPEGAESWGNNCCLNSPYGDALARFSVECLQKFDLDGIWFDGAGLHGGAVQQVVGCVCSHCGKRFYEETGCDIPREYDWRNESFRCWIQWRYDNFAANWQRLVDYIHLAEPGASVAFNHYHRQNAAWNGSIPLNPFGHDFISATEANADQPRRAALYAKCMRAYERGNSETWMGLASSRILVQGEVSENPKKIIDFAIGCCIAGGHPSMGGYTPHLKQIADEIRMRAPYLNLPSAAAAAIHISQQTETFVFGRDPYFITPQWRNYYWPSVVGWHNMISDCTLASDIIYDAHLTAEKLAEFKLLIMPLACALSRSQYEIILKYVRDGGRLFTGPWFGLFDPQGEELRIADEKIFPGNGNFPSWEKMGDALWGQGQNYKAHRMSLGLGEIVQFSTDLGGLYHKAPSEESLTNIKDLLKSLMDFQIEIDSEKCFHSGIFKRGGKEIILALQCVNPAWKPEKATSLRPETRWGAKAILRGKEPLDARAMLPEQGPPLPVKELGGSWLIELPPMTWGQIFKITFK